ncbi:MAG: penicillin-binding protein [Bacteriovoracaceae bacterium]|nr:penicillin-binding protein [Bacteriovoracaceae bacterium]
MAKNNSFRLKLTELKERSLYILMSPVRFAKFLLMVTGFFTWLVLFILLLIVLNFFNSLPKIEKMSFQDIKKQAIKTTTARYETKKLTKNYFWVEGPKISRYLMYAIVMSEDGQFFEHEGIDYNAVINSFANNLKQREYASGGSTLTQQVVKNIFLTNEKSLERKLREYFISKSLEQNLTKNKILELYLNIAEFGPDIYGVGQASLHYFGKSAEKITASEGAFLALMLPSPRKHYLSIYKNEYLSEKNRKKLRRILRDMLHLEYISPEQYQAALKYKYFK